jgi:hypothetical protein
VPSTPCPPQRTRRRSGRPPAGAGIGFHYVSRIRFLVRRAQSRGILSESTQPGRPRCRIRRRAEIREPIPFPSLRVRSGLRPTLRDETSDSPRVIPANAGLQKATSPGGLTLSTPTTGAALRRRIVASGYPLSRVLQIEPCNIKILAACFLSAKRSHPGAAVRLSGLPAPHMLWPLDGFVARALRNDGWVGADPIDSVAIGRRVTARESDRGLGRAGFRRQPSGEDLPKREIVSRRELGARRSCAIG